MWIAATLAGCWTLERERPGRPPRALDESRRSSLRPRVAAGGARFELVEETAAWRRFVFEFPIYCEVEGDFRTVRGDYYRTDRGDGQQGAPLLVVSPILAGPINDYLAVRYFCSGAADEGFHAFFVHQEELILDARRDAIDLEALLRQNVRDNLAALDLLAERPEVDAERMGSVGISFGAIKNVLMVAVEPRLRANALCLAGSNLPEILASSSEDLVEEYVAAREERDGVGIDALREEVRRYLTSEPARLAPAIDNARVLLVLGRLDWVVPYRVGLELREGLGGPETRVFPFGHYTSILVAPWVRSVCLEFLEEGLAAR